MFKRKMYSTIYLTAGEFIPTRVTVARTPQRTYTEQTKTFTALSMLDLSLDGVETYKF